MVFPVEQDNVQDEAKDDGKTNSEPAKPKFQEGDIVMCKDTENVWLRAQIEKIDTEKVVL